METMMMNKYETVKETVRRELHTQAHLVETKAAQVLNCPLLLGPPGAGKTTMSRDLAKEMQRRLVVVNCGENSDSTEVSGLPNFGDTKVLTGKNGPVNINSWVLNSGAGVVCTEPCILLIDDLDKAPPQIQAALLAISANRMFRDYPFHPMALLMAAGNRFGDDRLSSELSQSILTRFTAIELEPDVISFCEYGLKSGDVHPIVAGYLQYKPAHLYAPKDGVNRFPTPRGWIEASAHLKRYPDPIEESTGVPNWKGIISRKCGTDVGSDFWGWYSVIREIDLEKLLNTGVVETNSVMAHYAAIYLLSSTFNGGGVPSGRMGILPFVTGLPPELRVALLMQFSAETKRNFAKIYPEAAEVLMRDVARTQDPRAAA